MKGPYEAAEARSLIEPDFHDDSCFCKTCMGEDDGPEAYDMEGDR